MSLNAALGVASSGLLAVQRALAQAGANVANANTAGYTAKTTPLQARVLGPHAAGVLAGEAQRAVDTALIGQIGAANADRAAAALQERLLQGVEQAYGSVSGSASSLTDDIGTLRSAFITLQGSPEDAGAQRAAVQAAGKVARGFNAVGAAIGDARQQAQDAIGTQVAAANAALRQVGALNRQIQVAQANGASTAELADQRDLAVQALSGVLAVRTVQQADGALLVLAGSLVLPTEPNADAFSTSPANVAPGAYYGAGGTLPGVLLGGLDVTAQLQGGALGAAVELRDRTLPRYQAELDTAAATLAYRFDQEGLTLFSDSAGAVPDMALSYTTSGALGFANLVQVNSAVTANAAAVRDGTRNVSTGTGGVTDFTVNPPGGPLGFTQLINNVVNGTFGAQAALGVAWPTPFASGLGPNGTLSSSFSAPAGVQDYAGIVQSQHTNDRAIAAAAKEQAEGLTATLQQRFNTRSGVDVDAEMTTMIRLQQAYAANARVVSSVQQMWDALLGAVT
jgi:flagellar hook-associated protein 1 FlgK